MGSFIFGLAFGAAIALILIGFTIRAIVQQTHTGTQTRRKHPAQNDTANESSVELADIELAAVLENEWKANRR